MDSSELEKLITHTDEDTMQEDNVIKDATKDTNYEIVKYKKEIETSWKFWKKRRHVLTVLTFFGVFISYILRVNLSVAIVAMTENKVDDNGTIYQEFDWDSKTKGLVLSSFFYGYTTTQLLGGWLAARVGGKKIFGIGIIGAAFFTIITPPLVRISVYILIAIRIIEGIFEGLTYPCINALWANWVPPLERSKLATFAYSGSTLGTVFAMPVSGVMAEHLGWPSLFYIFGTAGIVWFVFWWIIIKDHPEDDRYITAEELEYIRVTTGNIDTKMKIEHPWKAILTSAPVWAIIVAHFSENWGFYTMLTQLPTFMKDVQNTELSKSGYLSALPYLITSIVMQIAGQLADYLRKKEILSTTQVRKIFNCGAFISQTIFMTCTAFFLSEKEVIIYITLAVGLGGFSWSGFGVNHLDVAPKHSSILMGISNTFATLSGVISPILTGYIVQNNAAAEWKIVFIIASAIYLIGALIYGLFASGEKQSWAEDGCKRRSKTRAYDNAGMEVDNL